MKWPASLTVVRHGESGYNALKAMKSDDPTYAEFKSAYNCRKKNPERARALAEQLLADERYTLKVGDHDTPLSERGWRQAERTGAVLSGKLAVPEVVFVSPYDRTHQTLEGMVRGWPELGEARVVEEERLREQEHGLALLYNDWRIFHVMHPDQDKLREAQGPYWYRYPQGENKPDVRERLRSWQTTLSRDYQAQDVMAIAHHLTLISLRANLERFGADEFVRIDRDEKPVNCGVTTYLGMPDEGIDGKLVLESYNEQLYPADI